MFEGKWDIRGVDQLMDRLKKMPAKLRGKVGRSALGSAARVVTNTAKQNALKVDDAETGRKIADNITQRFRSKHFKMTGDLMISIGVATMMGRIPPGNPDEGPKGNTPHWHLLELGTEQARAQPFLRPAIYSNMATVQEVFIKKMGQQLDKLVSR
jgi:HK97 gp10 family phage protein